MGMDVATIVMADSAVDQMTELYASSGFVSNSHGTIFELSYMKDLGFAAVRHILL
jgi:hypothetical protein